MKIGKSIDGVMFRRSLYILNGMGSIADDIQVGSAPTRFAESIESLTVREHQRYTSIKERIRFDDHKPVEYILG